MRNIFTLCLGLVAALTVQAQSNSPLQFADKDGNIIPDGTVCNITAFQEDDWGGILVPSGIYAKNISGEEVQAGAACTITQMANGMMQICFPEQCISKFGAGSFVTGTGSLAAGELRDMQTEWLPNAEGTAQMTVQLVTYKENIDTEKWEKDVEGPTITLNFIYDTSGIAASNIDEAGRSVHYYDVMGRHVDHPTSGIYIKKIVDASGKTTVRKTQIR